MIEKLLLFLGYTITTEKFKFPVVDGTYKYQTKIAFELFINPFQLTIQKRKGGVGKTINIQRETGDEYTID